MNIENEIPDHWELTKISEISEEMNTGSTPRRSNDEYWGGDTKWAKAGEISSAGKYISNTEEKVTKDASINTYGDEYVFVTIIGANLSSVVLPEDEMGINQQNVSIKLSDMVDREYFYYYIQSIAKYLQELGRGGGQQAINQTILGRVEIPVPPIEEQKMIVDKIETQLETLTVLSRSISQISELTREYESSLLAFLLAGKENLHEGDISTLPSESDIPSDWEIKELGELAHFQNGNGFSKDQWEEEGLPIIRIQNLTGTGDNFNYYSGEVDDRYRVETGDILFAWSGTIDAFKWDGGDAWLNQHIYRVDYNNEEVSRDYMYHLLKRSASILEKKKVGGTLQHIRKGDVTGLKVPVPPLDEQDKIVKQIETVDMNRVHRAVRDVNDLFQEYRESILAHAFTQMPNNEEQAGEVELVDS